MKILRPGDALTLAAGVVAVIALAFAALHPTPADRLLVRLSGHEIARLELDRAQTFPVRGPLGITVVEIAAQRARIRSDPGPRQLCVRQGWLTVAGDAAICLPNQVSIELLGNERRYDALTY